MDVLAQDLKYALASLRRDRGFAAMTVLTLALGVGINTTVFTFLHSTLLEPLPYPESDRLVMVWTEVAREGVTEAPTGYADVEDWRARNRSFEDLAAFDPATVTITGGEFPERISGVRVSANLFGVLRAPAALGRTISPPDEAQRRAVVVLSHGLWLRRFGGAPDVVGRTLDVAGTSHEVIGVMQQEFAYPGEDTELWLPITQTEGWEAAAARRGTDSWRVIGRLHDGVTVEQASADMRGIGLALADENPDTNAGLGVRVVPLLNQITGAPYRRTLWLTYGAVGFVLLIACANAAHLVVARAVGRAKDLTIRVALGASTARVLRQTVTECLVLAVAAGAVGTLIAIGGVELVRSVAPATTPRLGDVVVDRWALAYASAMSVATGLVFGVIPVLRRVRRKSPFEELRDGRGGSESARAGGARRVLIAGQVALAIVLVFGANLLIRSLLATRAVDPGFTTEGVLIANLSVESPSERIAFYEGAVRDVQTIPGVRAVAVIEDMYISSPQNLSFTPEGATSPTVVPEVRIDAIAGDLISAIGARLVEGRGFGPTDGVDDAPVAIVNESMARSLWPGESALSRRFTVGAGASGAIEVVGVVNDMRRQGPEREPIPQVFRPYAQSPSRNMNLLVRTDLPPPELASAIRSRLATLGPSVPLSGVAPAAEAMERPGEARRFETGLLGGLALIALMLATVGVHGLVSYSVSRRTREVGVRMALGARSQDVTRMVVREGLALTLPGMAIGTLAAAWLSDLMSAQVFGVSPADPASALLTAGVVLAATLLASYVPARIASRLDPVSALRK